MRKKVISIMLAAIMVVGMMPFGALAAGNVATIGTTEYPTLAAALAAVPKDETKTTITMIANVDFGEFEGNAITIAKGQNIVLDLGEFTISGTGIGGKASSLIKNNGTLEIKGNGTLTYKSTTPDPKWGYGTSTIDNQGKLTLTSGRVENMTEKGASYAIDNNSNVNNVKFIFDGGTVACPKGDMGVRQFCNSGKNTNDFVMNGGEIESGGFWLQMPSGSAERNGTVTINNGEINGMVDICSNSPENTFVNINGGTLNITKLRIRDNAPTVANTPFVNISGGTITIDAYDTSYSTDMNFLDITGGKIEDNVEGPNHDLWKQGINENCDVNEEGEVTEKAAAVCKIGDVEYSSLAAAVAAAPKDGTPVTIVMLDDEVIPKNTGITVETGMNITLNLAGKTISGSDNTGKGFNLITNHGTLTIDDTVGGGKITYVPETPDAKNGYATDTIYNFNGTLTVKDGTIECNPVSGGTSYAIENSSNWGGKSVLNIEGGTITANDNADSTIRVYMNGPATDLEAANKVNITGGTIEGYFNVSTFGDCNGTDGDINISGGTLNNVFLKQDSSTEPKADVDLTFSEDAKVTGKIMQSGKANIKEGFDVAIEGGTFGANAFTGGISADRINVSGGTFAAEVPIEYCAKGFTPQKNKDGKYEVDQGTLTNYYIDAKKCQSLDGKGGLMGRQYSAYDNSIGRAIIGLTTEQLNALSGSDKLVLVGGDYDAETTVEVDCAYTYFYNGEEKVTAKSMNVAAFVIIDANEFGGYISGYGYYRLYKDSAESEDNFLFDTLFIKPNN